MLERVTRSLSPIRHYFDGEIIDGVPAQLRGITGGVVEGSTREDVEELWGDQGHWLIAEDSEEDDDEEASGSGTEYDDDDDEEEDEEEDDDSDEEIEGDQGFGDGNDEEDGGTLDLQLIGHR
jgi:hypothetical protein